MKYLAELNTKEWKAKRNIILKRDKFHCVECKSTTNLQVHHDYYMNGKKAWEYPNDALRTLCEICHNDFHNTHIRVKSKSKSIHILMKKKSKKVVKVTNKVYIDYSSKELLPSEIDFNVIPMEPGTIIIKNEDKVLTACNFIQITGKAKTCKTNVLMSIISGCFSSSVDTLGLSINLCPEDKHVIYINTEMSAFDTWKHGLSVIKRLGSKPTNLHFINKMETRGEQLRKEVDEILQTYPPYLVVIDGIVDACEDFNNQMYSKNTVDWLNRLCNKGACGCIVALHQNPEALGKESKSRGHLGTFVEQRAISTFSTSKQRDYFTLRCSKMRHGTEFEVKYVWTSEGLETLEINNENPYITIIKDNSTLNRSEIVKLLSTSLNVSEAAVSKRLKRLSDLRIIEDDKVNKTIKVLNKFHQLDKE